MLIFSLVLVGEGEQHLHKVKFINLKKKILSITNGNCWS